MFEAIVINTWKDINKRRNQIITEKEHLKFSHNKRISEYLNCIVQTKNDTVRLRYESEIEKLQRELDINEEELKKLYSVHMTGEDSVRTVFEFLEKPYELWRLGTLEDKKLVLKLVFARGVAYDQKEGFRTASLSLPFRLSRDLADNKPEMVEPRRVELLTSCMPCKRSTN